MKVLLYDQLDPKRIPNFEKIRRSLEAGDFRSADVKKIGSNLYRARLDRSDRLLFSLYQHEGQSYILVLEHIAQHAYDKSRFLRRGASVDEAKLPDVQTPPATSEAEPLAYINPQAPTFHVLDKVLSFDDAQQAVYATTPPFIVIGSAGSGKTALTLEKMKQVPGRLLYVTRSAYLVRSSRDLYYALGYQNDAQEVDFLSFAEYLASWRVPAGRELTFRDFAGWFSRHRHASKLKDPHQLFEEFKGVLTGAPTDAPWLSLEAYRGLGVKQSIFAPDERERVYDLFGKYLAFMHENDLYDPNILSHEYLPLVEPRYDFVVVDEVQDVTMIQLRLILDALGAPGRFILCGDANQIVHPNFFSWSKLKSLFHEDERVVAPTGLIRILHSNYRNSMQVTELANRILKLKTARFGSVDRESHYLVHSTSDRPGVVLLLADDDEITRELNRKTRLSTRFAVIVMDEEQKRAAKARFETPLVFTVQEAKGLEYGNIILYNVASGSADRFREIAACVAPEDVLASEMTYGRAKDKTDKSLEIFKFHINALYVAITRAVENLYMIEANPDQRLFGLLGLEASAGPLDLAEQDSSLETWREEARKLELQGKVEQAEQIRTQILELSEVPWEVLTTDRVAELERRALSNGESGGGKKEKLLLFEYALVYQDGRLMNALARNGFKPAARPVKGVKPLTQKYFFAFDVRKPDLMLREVDRYGVDFRNLFNQTPLMVATWLGNAPHVELLVEMGADTGLVNNAGLNAFQIALEQACVATDFAAGKLEPIYELLKPRDLVVQTGGRLVKLDSGSMEFLLLNLMIAMFYTRLADKVAHAGGGLASGDFVDVLVPFPDAVVPERRKRRAYISSILAKNEVDRDDRYNRRLFRRVRHGHYIIDPDLSFWVEGSWRRAYELLNVDSLGYDRSSLHTGSIDDDRYLAFFDAYALRQIEQFKAFVGDRRAVGDAKSRPRGR